MQTKQLPVSLTREELALKSDQLAAKIHEGKDLENDLSRVKADYKSRLEDNKSEIDKLACAVRDKEEMRQVQVIERRDEFHRSIETVRVDTSEVVEIRPMTVQEMQGDLFKKEPSLMDGMKETLEKDPEFSKMADDIRSGEVSISGEGKTIDKDTLGKKVH